MIAIKDQSVSKKFFAAVWLLSILDNTLDAAHTGVEQISYPRQHGDMRKYYERMREAKNLHTAASEALTTAAARLLSEDSVNTFFMLAEISCLRAVTAMEHAVRMLGDINDTVLHHERLKAAYDAIRPKAGRKASS